MFFSFQSTAEMIVNVEDINDQPPKFDADAYFGNVLENSNSGAFVKLVSRHFSIILSVIKDVQR